MKLRAFLLVSFQINCYAGGFTNTYCINKKDLSKT